jgi:hypothetical protein
MNVRLVLATALLAGAPVCVAQTVYPEFEPNETRANCVGHAIAAMAPGDILTGNTTGFVTTAGANSEDTWDVTTAAAPSAGIWRYRLNITSTGTDAFTGSIRGLTQLNGVIGTTDTALQTTSATPPHYVQWYANENPSRIYFRITGTSSTTSPYTVTLQRDPITPNVVPNAVDAGPLFITTIGQTTQNTEVWLYDANFVAIVDAGNDNTATTTQCRLERNLPAGDYYLAISNNNLANNLASPVDDSNRSGNVLDFPNALCTNSVTVSANNNFVIGNRCTGVSQSFANTQPDRFEIQFWKFTLAGTQIPDPVAFGAGTPVNVLQGSSATLTVTASGATPTSVTADLSAFGLSNAEAFHDDGLNGDATAGDNIWSYSLPVSAAQASGPYTINVTGNQPNACVAATGSISLTVNPVNNTCGNAIPIVIGGSYAGSTLGALAAGGSSTTCNSITGTNPGVWYTFTEGPVAHRLRAHLCDPTTDFDAKMVAYTITNPLLSCGPTNFTCTMGNDTNGQGCPNVQNAATYVASGQGRTNTPIIMHWPVSGPGTNDSKCTVPNTTYYICVMNTVSATGGHFVLHLDDTGEQCQGSPPPNNACANARQLSTFPFWDVEYLADSVAGPTPVTCSDPANTTARGACWYKFTPTQPGDFYHAVMPVQTVTGNDSVLTVYTASPDCSALTPVVCNNTQESYDDWFHNSPLTRTPVCSMTAGTTYYIEYSLYSPTAAIPNNAYLGFDFVPTGPAPCYANCDGSTTAPVLNVGDFTCFLQKYAANDPYANCDGSTTPPVLNVGDFTCFLQKYAAGCP